jgi:hypothetical protein
MINDIAPPDSLRRIPGRMDGCCGTRDIPKLAGMANGVLTVTIPKTAATAAKNIEVKAAA